MMDLYDLAFARNILGGGGSEGLAVVSSLNTSGLHGEIGTATREDS